MLFSMALDNLDQSQVNLLGPIKDNLELHRPITVNFELHRPIIGKLAWTNNHRYT